MKTDIMLMIIGLIVGIGDIVVENKDALGYKYNLSKDVVIDGMDLTALTKEDKEHIDKVSTITHFNEESRQFFLSNEALLDFERELKKCYKDAGKLAEFNAFKNGMIPIDDWRDMGKSTYYLGLYIMYLALNPGDYLVELTTNKSK